MSLWDLPPISSLKLDSAGFAESNVWLPESISQSLILWDGAMLKMLKVIKGHTEIRLLSSKNEIDEGLIHSSIKKNRSMAM